MALDHFDLIIIELIYSHTLLSNTNNGMFDIVDNYEDNDGFPQSYQPNKHEMDVSRETFVI